MTENHQPQDDLRKYAGCPPVLAACIRTLRLDPAKLDWLTCYIPPLVRTNAKLPGTSGLKPNRELAVMPVASCLGLVRHLILCGSSGCGRATLARALARLAIHEPGSLAGCHPDLEALASYPFKPVFMPIYDVKNSALQQNARDIREAVPLAILDGRGRPEKEIQETIKAFSGFSQENPDIRVLVLADGDANHWMHAIHEPDWAVAEIQPLNGDQAGWFVARWLDVLSGNLDDQKRKSIRRFEAGWQDDPGWVRQPLELTLALFFLSNTGGTLPALREQVFSEILPLLVGSDNLAGNGDITLQAHESRSNQSLHRPNESIRLSGISIMKEIGIPGFLHSALHRHQVAAHLAGLPLAELIPSCLEMLDADREVVRTALVLLGLGQPEMVPHAMQAILEERNPALALAACGSLARLWEHLDAESDGIQTMTPRCRKSLLAVIASQESDARQRVEAGNTLSVIGDMRFNANAWHLPDDGMLGFVAIPEGDFFMGTDEATVPALIEALGVGSDWDGQTLGDMLSIEPNLDLLVEEMGLPEGWESLDPVRILPQWYKREIPQHRLWLPACYIARYPVTTAQFQLFITESGYPFSLPALLPERKNHPVTGVQWADAMAYCRWLHQVLAASDRTPAWLRSLLKGKEGWRVTLPSEAEWEKAARGSADGENPKRLFPWGDGFDAGKANLKEAGIGTTSSVGCFPGGASPYGVQDLAGNVWEWTRSMWGEEEYRVHYPYPYNPCDGRESRQPDRINALRVLRGASYNNYQRYARCATRRSPFPELKSSARGFRVAISRNKIS